MVSGLREKIRVGAVFEGGWPRPVWFDYRGRKVPVRKIFYRWREKRAWGHIIKFSVFDGSVLYEIYFDPLNLNWVLTAMDDSGSGDVFLGE